MRLASVGTRRVTSAPRPWSGSLRCHSSAAAAPLPALAADQLALWTPLSVQKVLQQAARSGAVQAPLLQRLRGQGHEHEEVEEGSKNGTDETTKPEELPLEMCSEAELIRVAELCSAFYVRDFVLLAALAETFLPIAEQAPVESLLKLTTAYADLGALNAPLFNTTSVALLAVWTEDAEHPSTAQVTKVARNFSVQRVRDERLFERLRNLLLRVGTDSLTPAEARSLLHSHSFLRLDAMLGDLWDKLEQVGTQPGLEQLGPVELAELCYILFLSKRDASRLEDITVMLAALSKQLPATRDAFWSASGTSLHRRLLLLRSCIRYLHRDVYKQLPPSVADAFRQVHRMEPPQREPPRVVSFVRKLSAVLTKLKVGHVCSAERGPFLLDVIERDRKLVYECNHFDRFYANSIEKIASMCLQERVVKAMGYRVVQVPHWQWTKIKHRRQRMEYLRMSRYYAIKDRREFTPRDESSQDLATNEFDHLGEYFFKKEAPSASWSWFQPQYDARRRLPSERAA